MPHISLSAETLWTVAGFPITNSLLTTWLVMAFLIIWAWSATRSMKMIPGNAQQIAEIIVGGLYDMFESVAGKYVKMAFPLLASLFLFIIIGNWAGLLPGVGTIGFRHEAEAVHEEEVGTGETHESVTSESALPADEHAETAVADEHAEELIIADGHEAPATEAMAGAAVEEGEHEEAHATLTPLFRGTTADLNMTLALAVVAVIAIQYYGFRAAGIHYSGRFFDLSNPINFFVGILEIVSDISKIMSFAFRLFGNIFAGEVLLAVIAFLIPLIVPLPFLFLELFVGFVQALVFSMLTAVFLNVSLAHGEHIAHQARGDHGHDDADHAHA